MSIRQAAGRIAGAALLAVMAGILSLHGATGAAAAAINPFVMAPSFTLSTLNLTFFTGVGVNPAPQTVTLKTGSSPVRWTTSVDQPWLIVNPKQGNTRPNRKRTLTVSIDVVTTALAANPVPYVGHITVKNKKTGEIQTITVTLHVTDKASPVFNPVELDFNAAFNGTTGFDGAAQTTTLFNFGILILHGTLTVNDGGLGWLKVTPLGDVGSVPPNGGSVVLSVSTSEKTAKLAPSATPYQGTITVSDPAANPTSAVVNVFMTVHDQPFIVVNPMTVGVDQPVGGCPGGPDSVTISVTDGGTGPLNWSASIDNDPVTGVPPPWLTLVPTVPQSPAGGQVSQATVTFTVQVDASAAGSPTLAGTYPEFITISSNDPVNPTVQVEIDLSLNDVPTVALIPDSPAVIQMTVTGGAADQTTNVVLENEGPPTLTWGATIDFINTTTVPWLTVAPANNAASTHPSGLGACQTETLTLTVKPSSFTVNGTYSALLTVTDGSDPADSDTVTIEVTVTDSPVAHVSPDSVSLSAIQGSTTKQTQAVTLTNIGKADLAWTTSSDAAWLTVSPVDDGGTPLTSASLGVTLTVSADPTGLVPDLYTGHIIVSGPGATSAVITVSFTITPVALPTLTIAPGALGFDAVEGGSAPAGKIVTVTNNGGAPFTWTAVADQPWVVLVPPVSTTVAAGGSQDLTIQVTITGLGPGVYVATVTIDDGVGDSLPVTVTLTITAPPGTSIVISSAGWCGALGLEVLLPMGLIWGVRRLRLGRRIRTFVAVLICALVLPGMIGASSQAQADEETGLPRSLQDQEVPQRPAAGQAQPEVDKPDLFDFEGSYINGHGGYLFYSHTFNDSGSASGGVLFDVPSPLISKTFGSDPHRVGFFVDLTVAGLHRDIVTTQKTSGTTLFVSFGPDVYIYHDESIRAQIQGGGQYGYFGGVTKVTNGFAGMVGLRGAVSLAQGVWVSVNPQAAFASGGNDAFFLNFGLDIDF
jgi:hypothetical protein